MPIKAVQQMMLGKVLKSEEEALTVLETVKAAGYDGIELNGYMIRPTPLFVRALTAAAGMPAGKGGRYDWPGLTRAAKLAVVALHQDLGTIQKDPDAVLKQAGGLGTDKVVVTGMYRFDYTDEAALAGLCRELNHCGAYFRQAGVELLYHNHNVELCRLKGREQRAYDFLLTNTDPTAVNFEFDSYWFTDGGANAVKWMEKLGRRMRRWHINDRGTRQKGAAITPIVKADSIELGYGSMDLDSLTAAAKANGIAAVVLESHRNHVDGDPVKSLQRSAAYLNRHFSR